MTAKYPSSRHTGSQTIWHWARVFYFSIAYFSKDRNTPHCHMLMHWDSIFLSVCRFILAAHNGTAQQHNRQPVEAHVYCAVCNLAFCTNIRAGHWMTGVGFGNGFEAECAFALFISFLFGILSLGLLKQAALNQNHTRRCIAMRQQQQWVIKWSVQRLSGRRQMASGDAKQQAAR